VINNGVYEFYFASCTMNIIFNELRQQQVKMFIQRGPGPRSSSGSLLATVTFQSRDLTARVEHRTTFAL